MSHYGVQLYGNNVKYKNQMNNSQKAINQQDASIERVPVSPNMPPVSKEAESLLKSKHSAIQSPRVFYMQGLINLQGTNNPFIIQIVLERGERD